MAQVTQTRDSGIELLDADIDDMHEDAEGSLFRTSKPVRIQVGESVGVPLFVEHDYFVVASIDGTQEIGALQAQMQGLDEDDPQVTEVKEDGTVVVEANEASVFLSNEDGEVGGGVTRVEGGDMDDALAEFEAEYL